MNFLGEILAYHMPNGPQMTDHILVLPGPDTLNLASMRTVAEEFGWKIRVAEALGEVAAVTPRKVAAVFFHRNAFGAGYSWRDAIRFLKVMLPGVPLVVLRRFAEPVDWPGLSDEGAFHSLWLPLKESEVRQSLGFLANAERRPACFPARSTSCMASAISSRAATAAR